MALHDIDQAFRVSSGAGNHSKLGAANTQLGDLLLDPNSGDDFYWDDVMSAIKFTTLNAIPNFNHRDHCRVMFLLFLQIIIFIAMELEKPPSKLSAEDTVILLQKQLQS